MKNKILKCILVGIVATGTTAVYAETYPSKPINLVVPFLPGGSPDMVARTFAQKLQEALGQTVVVENRPGANGIIGLDYVAKSQPDGYTLLIADTGMLSINPSLYKKIPYDTQTAFAPIAQVMATPLFIAVGAQVPAKNLKELVELSKTDTPVRFGSPGKGSALQLGVELFKKTSGARFEHIPYKGIAQVPIAVLSGDVQVMYSGYNIIGSHIKNGKMRALAVGSATRAATMPDVPTVAEAGYAGFEMDSKNGFLAPAGTPKEIIDRLNAELQKIVSDPELQKRFEAVGIDIIRGSTPEQYTQNIRADAKKYAQIINEGKFSID